MCLLAEYPNHDNPLANRSHIKRASNAVAPLQAHLPEFPVQVFDVGLAKVDKTRLSYTVTKPDKTRPQIRRECSNLGTHRFVQDLDRPGYAANISYLR